MKLNYQLNNYFRYACERGDIRFAKKLLNENPQIDIFVFNEEPFRSACVNGYLDIAKWLLKIRPQINISEKMNLHLEKLVRMVI